MLDGFLCTTNWVSYTGAQQQKIKAEKQKGVRVIWFSLPVLPPILIGFVHNRSWSSGHTRLLICWYLLSEKTKGGGPAPEREKGGKREVNEDQMRPPRHKRRWEAKMATVAGEGPCGVHLRLIYHRGNGGSSLSSPPPPILTKATRDYLGLFSLLKFLRPNLQCDWSPVTDRTNIRPTVISFLFSFSGGCYCCW